MDYNEIKRIDKFRFLNYSKFINSHELCFLVNTKKTFNSLEELELIGFCLDSYDEVKCNGYKNKVFNSGTAILYTFNQLLDGLIKCDTNVLKLFGCDNENIIFINEHAEYLKNNLDLFLNKKSVMYSFGGHAWKLKGIIEKDLSKLNYYTQEEKEEILLKNMYKYFELLNMKDDNSLFNLHLENGNKMLVDISMKNVSFKKLKNMMNNMDNVLGEYGRIQCEKSNNIILRNSTLKTASNLAEIYLIAIDIFKGKGIRYIRDDEIIDNIKNRKYDADEMMILLNSLEEEMNLAKRKSNLPDDIDKREINKLRHYFKELSLSKIDSTF
ncbi:MAG: hypothetical protein E6356_13860 [Terrisporobacter othiniensis]|nr:hypothetical protein [Terrisporobacter othiniensis]